VKTFLNTKKKKKEEEDDDEKAATSQRHYEMSMLHCVFQAAGDAVQLQPHQAVHPCGAGALDATFHQACRRCAHAWTHLPYLGFSQRQHLYVWNSKPLNKPLNKKKF
jgi:hypothetical protein